MPKKFAKEPVNLLLIATTLFSFLFFLWGVNSWKFAFTGDDWPFYLFAVKLLHSHALPNPFSFNGVYDTHSQLISMYQALFMYIFGPTNFAWRLSNIILIIPLSYFFYRFVQLQFDKNTAVLATILLQCSFYLANFFKIGYDNPQSLTLFVICLYLAARFGKKPELLTGFLLGSVLGISFYVYFGASFPLFILPFLIPAIIQIHKKQFTGSFVALIGMYVFFLIPLTSQMTKLFILQHALTNKETLSLNSTVFYDFFLFYKNHDYFYNHFVVGPYLDLVTQIFCLIGTVLVFLRSKQNSYSLLLLSYVIVVLFLGVTSADSSSPITRGIFLLPYGFIFAGIGLNTVRESIKNTFASFAFCWIILLAVATVNVYQSQIGIFTDKKAGYTGTALIIRTLQEDSANRPVKLILSANLNINTYTWMLSQMRKAYGLSDIPFYIIRPDKLSCTAADKKSILLVFKQDTKARNKISTLHCTYYQTSVLSPTITYY